MPTGEEVMATGGLAGALMSVKLAQGDDCLIGDIEVEMVDGLAQNVLRMRVFDARFKVTVERIDE